MSDDMILMGHDAHEEKKLLVAVIEQAIDDLAVSYKKLQEGKKADSHYGNYQSLYVKVRAWFLEDNPCCDVRCFKGICSSLGINAERFRDAVFEMYGIPYEK
jgi:hypothetical protein